MIKVAKIVDINDKLQKGRVQVRIYPEFADFKKEDLPWAKPLMPAFNKVHKIPELNSVLYIEVSSDWIDFNYLDSIEYIVENYKYEEVAATLKNKTEMSSFTYPDPDFIMNPNGFIQFFNKSNTETGFIHPSGTYVIFKENGDYIIKNPNMFEINFSNNKVEINSVENINFTNSKSITLGDSATPDIAVLFAPLKTILGTLASHTHTWSQTLTPTTLLSAAPGVPVTGTLTVSGTSSASSDLSAIQTDLKGSEILNLT